MSLEAVLEAVPFSRVLGEPTRTASGAVLVIAGHDDIEVAELDGAARFELRDGGLARATIELRHRGDHEATVFKVRRLVVMLSERWGPAARLTEEPAPGSPAGTDGVRKFDAAWRADGVEVDLRVTVRGGEATGTVSAAAEPS